jgi:hypothetical protein
MNEIDFSYNWNNKLENKCFSTIRIYNPKKYVLNQNYKILLNSKHLYDAKIVFEKGFYINQLSEPMSFLDTGYSKNETIDILKKMYKNKIDLQFHFIILKKNET